MMVSRERCGKLRTNTTFCCHNTSRQYGDDEFALVRLSPLLTTLVVQVEQWVQCLCAISDDPVWVRGSGPHKNLVVGSYMTRTPWKFHWNKCNIGKIWHQERISKPRKRSKLWGLQCFDPDSILGAYSAPPDSLAGGEGNIPSPRTPPTWAIQASLFGPSGLRLRPFGSCHFSGSPRCCRWIRAYAVCRQ